MKLIFPSNQFLGVPKLRPLKPETGPCLWKFLLSPTPSPLPTLVPMLLIQILTLPFLMSTALPPFSLVCSLLTAISTVVSLLPSWPLRSALYKVGKPICKKRKWHPVPSLLKTLQYLSIQKKNSSVLSLAYKTLSQLALPSSADFFCNPFPFTLNAPYRLSNPPYRMEADA